MTEFVTNRPTVFTDSIFILAALLQPDRRQLFMNWLRMHSGQLVCNGNGTQERIHNYLVEWFKALPESQALQEYELIISEIGWWRDLKEETLARILNEMEAG